MDLETRDNIVRIYMESMTGVESQEMDVEGVNGGWYVQKVG